jgi:hypothetical protein
MTVEPTSLAVIVRQFEARMNIARASELASFGRILEAEALIAHENRAPKTWDEIDLLARIRVRQGKFAEAVQLWKQSLSLRGHEETARARVASLELYAAAHEKRRWLILFGWVAAWVTAEAVFISLFLNNWLR